MYVCMYVCICYMATYVLSYTLCVYVLFGAYGIHLCMLCVYIFCLVRIVYICVCCVYMNPCMCVFLMYYVVGHYAVKPACK